MLFTLRIVFIPTSKRLCCPRQQFLIRRLMTTLSLARNRGLASCVVLAKSLRDSHLPSLAFPAGCATSVICAHDQKREHGCLPPGTSANPACRCPLARPIAAAARTRLLSLPVVLTKKARAIEAACPCAFLYKSPISQLLASPRGLDAKTTP